MAEQSGWIPVHASLPPEHVTVLTHHEDDLTPQAAFRFGDEWLRQTEGPEDEPGPGKWGPLYRPPTHWMPLPLSPSLSAALEWVQEEADALKDRP